MDEKSGQKNIAKGINKKNKSKRIFLRILRNALFSLGAAIIITFLVITVVPLIFNITLIPGEPRNVALLTTLLAIVYFVLSLIVSWFKGKRVTKIIVLSIGMIISTILMVAAVYIANTFSFLNSTKIGEYEYNTYAIVVMKDNEYNKISELDNKKIGVMKTNEDLGAYDTLRQNTGLSFQMISIDDGVSGLANALLNGEVAAINIEQGRLNFLYDEIENFEDDTRLIYTYKAQVKSYEADAASLPNEPFVVYLSGIDQYGKTDSVVGRSDVNQLIVVNPRTHEILLVNTPRDYYVQLSGTSGLKDKLTHAGVYGIETSIKTIEELYDVDIDYYVRVNFDSVINVVDQIGGIDIVSDQEFTAHTNSNVHVVEGQNHFNGKQALAYARERYAYETGDRHRGENQQQVITAIIDKITGSKTLLSNYNNIISSLSGTFQTNMPTSMIIDLFQEELMSGAEWHIETISVDGTGSMQPTYSMGANLPLYVMIPNEQSVERARIEITDVIEGR